MARLAILIVTCSPAAEVNLSAIMVMNERGLPLY